MANQPRYIAMQYEATMARTRKGSALSAWLPIRKRHARLCGRLSRVEPAGFSTAAHHRVVAALDRCGMSVARCSRSARQCVAEVHEAAPAAARLGGNRRLRIPV